MKIIEVIFNSGDARIIKCEKFYWESDNILRFKDADDKIIAKICGGQLAGWIDVTQKTDGELCPCEKEAEEEWICPNCQLYDTENPNYCQYVGEFTTGCKKCRYFEPKTYTDERR